MHTWCISARAVVPTASHAVENAISVAAGTARDRNAIDEPSIPLRANSFKRGAAESE
jgi:hypothetical protein